MFSLIKVVIGNVEVAEKGSLQEQIKKLEQGNNLVEFEDYSSGEEILNPEDAINQIASGKPAKVLNQYIKIALKGLLELAQRALNVAMGKNQARIFATIAALDAWLAVPENVEQLKIGDNFYITSPDVPDYWWDGAQKQELETQKVDLTTYDREIAALKQKDSELSGNISSHNHNSMYYTETEVDAKLDGKSDTSHNHAWSAITGKPNTFAPSSHSHAYSAITGRPMGLDSGYVRTGQKAGTSLGDKSTAEGSNTTASGTYSHAEGSYTTASGGYSHAECISTTASGDFAHAEGGYTTASRPYSHAEGSYTTASGDYSHAEGKSTKASGNSSHAGGQDTIASSEAQTAIGIYNVQYGTAPYEKNSLFIVGNGSSSARSNAFRVHNNGVIYSKGAYNTSGADYAEYFEWLDGNPKDEDRRGYFVTLDGDKIRKATTSDDYILGIISGKPSVVGNSDPDGWHKAFMCDEFGEFIMEKTPEIRTHIEIEEVEETYIDEDGNEAVQIVPKKVERKETIWIDSYVLDPNYNPDGPYITREERPEWATVGMLGALKVRDDGTCKVNGYCRPTDDGVATASTKGYRVIERVSENIIKVVFR